MHLPVAAPPLQNTAATVQHLLLSGGVKRVSTSDALDWRLRLQLPQANALPSVRCVDGQAGLSSLLILVATCTLCARCGRLD